MKHSRKSDVSPCASTKDPDAPELRLRHPGDVGGVFSCFAGAGDLDKKFAEWRRNIPKEGRLTLPHFKEMVK